MSNKLEYYVNIEEEARNVSYSYGILGDHMVRKILLFSLIIGALGACNHQETGQKQPSNPNIQEGELNLNGKGENWIIEAKIKTKVSVNSKNNSVIVVPLDSKGEINLISKSKYEEEIEVEYFLERFEAKGKEILSEGETNLKFLFEGGIPYSESESEFELTIKWLVDGEEKQETIILK